MNISEAKTLKPGQRVRCPADRGDSPFVGRVGHVSTVEAKAFGGAEYIWVTIIRDNGMSGGVWPSNRLVRP